MARWFAIEAGWYPNRGFSFVFFQSKKRKQSPGLKALQIRTLSEG
jgi:hypothetical protein